MLQDQSNDAPIKDRQKAEHMARKRVTLKATLKRGEFYWVADVDASSEEEAVVAAENLFLSEMERIEDWEFTDFEVA